MQWNFAKNEGGRESGFNDAGIETFKGNFDRYLARELIQNSLDARLDPTKPVHVHFELVDLDKTDIPDMDRLQVALTRCYEYYSNDDKAVAFFKRAESIAKVKKISCLKISDFNTKGVLGSDTDKKKDWYNLIRCAGSSSKGGGEGGSKGIGKNAPFAASQLRTVLYSTYNNDREYIFQGVATLVTHLHPDGIPAQPVGYLGGDKGASVRVKKEIPSKFLRKDLGTDIIILGFQDGALWQKDLIYSVLDNYWPAIEFGDLIVSVGTTEINRENLKTLLESYSGEEEFSAHLYYTAYKNPTASFHENLRKLKQVSLYLYAGEADLPKHIAMVRKTGMVIFPKQFRIAIPFCGVFICQNDEGNKLLRDMEPPRHDKWDPDHPEKGVNKKIESEYVGFIRECLKKLLPVDNSKVISIPGLNRFLPDDDETPEEAFGNDGEESKQESPDRRQLPGKISGRKMDPRRKSMQPDQSRPGEGDGDTEGDIGDGEFGKEDQKQKGGKGEGGGGGGGDGGNKKDAKGSPGGVQSKPSIPVKYRTYARNIDAGVYAVSIQPDKPIDKEVNLVILAVGDDQRIPVEIKASRLQTGQEIKVSGLGVIGPVKLPPSGPFCIEVVLKAPMRVAMEVSAHEA